MKQIPIIAVATLVFGLGLVGCGGGTDSPASPPPETPEIESPVTTPEIESPVTTPVGPSAADRRSLRLLREQLAYVKQGDAETDSVFNSGGEPKWGQFIARMTVKDGVATIQTSIYPDGDAVDGRFGVRICNTFASADDSLSRVRVFDSRGGVLKSCSPFGG